MFGSSLEFIKPLRGFGIVGSLVLQKCDLYEVMNNKEGKKE